MTSTTENFDGKLVLGTVLGARSFYLTKGSLLRSRVQRHVWTTGVNEAGCSKERDADGEHPPGTMGCSCGFYAYTDKSDPENNFLLDVTKLEEVHRVILPIVEGVIEAYGRVTVGNLGFRAERAKIVALTVYDVSVDPELPARVKWDAMSEKDRKAHRDICKSPWSGDVHYGHEETDKRWPTLSRDCIWADLPEEWPEVKEAFLGIASQYPGVNIFRDRETMYSEYPLTQQD